MQDTFRAVITRFPQNGKQTLGEFNIYQDNRPIFRCCTLELPYLNNEKFVSCIPVGTYLVVKRKSPHSRFTYEHLHLKNVTGRQWILIHIGNYTRQIEGCILVGRKHKDIDRDGLTDVTSSRVTLRNLLKVVPNNFSLQII